MAFQPMPLSRRPLPFDHPDLVFELKYDGFRSLAIIQNDRCQLISRNGHAFSSFPELQTGLGAPGGKTVFDDEIVCLDRKGKPRFRDLLFHRGQPCFFAFDLLMRWQGFAFGTRPWLAFVRLGVCGVGVFHEKECAIIHRN
jgi:bifunctional non-homologous end joining protein LigD